MRSTQIAVFACMAMVIMLAVTPWAMGVGNKWLSVGIAALLMGASVAVFGLTEDRRPERKSLYVACYLLNSMANGFSVATFYIHEKYAVTTAAIMPGMLPAAALMLLTALLLWCLPKWKRWILCAAFLGAAALIVTCFVPALWPADFSRSAMLFSVLVALMYLVVYGVNIGRKRGVMRDIAYGSFGAMILVLFVVLMIISDGEALEGMSLDGDIELPWRRRKKG